MGKIAASLFTLLVIMSGPPNPTSADIEFYGSPWMKWNGHLIISKNGMSCIVGPLTDEEWAYAVSHDRPGACVYLPSGK